MFLGTKQISARASALVAAFGLCATLLASAILALPAQAREELPIDAWAMRPVMDNVAVSPDGRHIAYMRTSGLGSRYIIEVREVANLGAEPVRLGADRMEIRSFFWANDDRLVVNLLQPWEIGNTDTWIGRIASVSRTGQGRWIQLPRERSMVGRDTVMQQFSDFLQAQIVSTLPRDPDHILISYDEDFSGAPDILKINVNNGRTETVAQGTSRLGGYAVDLEGNVRIAQSYDAGDNAIIFYSRGVGEDAEWREIYRQQAADREDFAIIGFFNPDNANELIVRANRGNDKSGLYRFNALTGQFGELLFQHPDYDASSVATSNRPGDEGRLLGYTYQGPGIETVWLDPENNEGKMLADALKGVFPKTSNSVVSRSRNDEVMVIRTSGPTDPGSYYLLLNGQNLQFLGSEFPLIKEEHLSELRYVVYEARDGRDIPAYVTIPQGEGPFPAIVLPHGGPWVREYFGYDFWPQMLAHYGYLVIQPQYRGSTGFGIDHWVAGDAKWGLEMQDDLDDAALYLVEEGLADRDRLAMLGYSYGGYASFVAALRTPQIYQCAMPGAGVADLGRIRAGLAGSRFLRELQRPTIKGVSPIDQVSDVNIPMQIMHPVIDRTVDVSHSRDFVAAMRRLGKEHEYIEIEGMDHQIVFWSYEHRTQYFTAMIDYLRNRCGPGGL